MASDLGSKTGEVRLLLLREDGTVHVTPLRVRRVQDADPLGGTGPMAGALKKAARVAYAACSQVSVVGPRYAYDGHRFEIDAAADHVIDGDAFALPLALAMASLWLERPIEVGATGGLFFGGGTWRIGAAANLEARAATFAQSQGRRLLGPAAIEGLPGGVPVGTLAEAFVQAGLPLADASFEPTLGGVSARRSAVAGLIDAVKESRAPADRSDPWYDTGEALRTLIGTLRDTDTNADLLDRARASAAVAFLRAGDLDTAAGMFRELSDESVLGPATRLARAVADLGRSVDQESWQRCGELTPQIEAGLDDRSEDVQRLQGRAWVAIGRAHLHQRHLEAALTYLERGVSHHTEHLPHEVGRARQYLAMALREADRPSAALLTLDEAHRDLQTLTRPSDLSSYESFKIYVDYERARTQVALDRGEEAVEAAQRAYDAAKGRGPWPAMAILRTLAWAHRMSGRADEADEIAASIAEMRVFPGLDKLRDGFAEEARGGPISGGQVH